MIEVNLNKRVDPVLHRTDVISDETLQRVAKIALPFLSLNAKTGMLASVGMGSYQAWTIAQDISAHYGEDGWLEFGCKSFHLVVVVSATAFSILFPLVQFAVSNVYQLGVNLYTLVIQLKECEGLAAAKTSLEILHQLIYIASVCLATSEWIALSLLIQAAVEAGQAYHAYAEKGLEHLPEIIANIVLASLRVYMACPHLKTVHRNYLGKQLSQTDWFWLYGEIYEAREKHGRSELVEVESFLIEKGISSYIKEINFGTTSDLTRLQFSNLRFQKCDFSSVNFEGSRFHKIRADSCLFEHASWINTTVMNSIFNQCDFRFTSIVHAYFHDVTFSNSNLSYACFNDSVLQSLSLRQCKMQETSFLMAAVRNGAITDSDLTDCLLLDARDQFRFKNCTPNKITKPVVGIGWNFREMGIFTPMIDHTLRKNGAIPLRFEYIPEDVSPELLQSEVQQLIAQVQAARPANMLSIPAEILKRAEAGSQLARVKERAASYLKHCNGLALPGGLDIQPEFYGAEKAPETFTDSDYRRSMIEFALLSEANQRKTPTLGTCRGSQLINIFFGGALKQHVPGQGGFQRMEFTDSSRKEWMRSLVGDDFHGYSAHHQASERMGRDLEVVMKAGDVTKFFISRDETFIGSQIHPEVHPQLEIEKKMLEDFIAQGKITLDDELRNTLALLDKSIRGNRNIYNFFIEKARANV